MSKIKLLFAVVFATSCFFITNVFADDKKQEEANAFNQPKPLENKVFDAMVGTWKADSEMMGIKMHETMKVRWSLNHQFLILDVKATSKDKKNNYEGMGVFGIDAKGKAKTWWFDNWGADAAAIGTGEFEDNKLSLEDSNEMMKEKRSFEVKGNEMIMHAEGTMTMDGKETPYNTTTTYKKK